MGKVGSGWVKVQWVVETPGGWVAANQDQTHKEADCSHE